MASPVNFGDVVKAIELCHWFHKNCFNPINNASVLYVGFRDDVRNLEKSIKQFQASFENAIQQLRPIDLSRLDLLRLESEELVGDYLGTLEDCKQLLKKHAKFNGERATALDNAFWHAKSQPRVDVLRKRLQSHSYKIYLFIEPVRIDLVANISADTQEILALLRQHFGLISPTQLPDIPPAIGAALSRALATDCPAFFDTPRDIPLREGVDALCLHYRECTVGSSSSGIGPDVKQKMSLLKAHWLFRTLESSASVSQSRQGSLFRRVVEQVGQGIEGQYKKFEIEKWDEEDYAAPDDAAWAIWPIKESPKPPVPTDPTGREEKLAEVPLLCPYPERKEDLFIFRVSDKTLRMVTSRSGKNEARELTERFIDLDTDGLVPFYALAPSDGNCYRVNLTNGKGGGSVSYEFPSRRIALEVQTAFTGYNARSLSTGVSCSVIFRGGTRLSRSLQETAIGEVQLWRWPVSISQNDLSPSSETSASSHRFSMSSGSGYSSAAKTFEAFDPNIVTITDAQDGGEMMIAELPPPPVLAFLVQRDSKYTMWHVELSQLELKKNLRHKNTRYRSILEKPTGKPFSLRKLTVNESQLDFWNIRAIAVPNFTPPKGKKQPAVEKIDGTSIVLDFASEQQQTDFEGHFKRAAVERMKQVNQFNLSRYVAVSQADVPRRASDPPPSVQGISASVSTIRPMSRKDSKGPPMSWKDIEGRRMSLKDTKDPPMIGPIPTFIALDD